MGTYVYKAKDGPEHTVEGELQAASHAGALAAVERLGYSPVWVREKADEQERGPRFRGGRVRAHDITVFTRQLGSLIKSGVPILKALRTIRNQVDRPRFRAILKDLELVIRDGNMLSGALSRYPRLFSPLYVDMVRAGEMGGILDVSLQRLAEAREQEDDLRRKVQAAMAYPVLVLVVGIVTVFVLLSFFLPRVLALFENYEDIPLPTQILMTVSGFFSAYWVWMVAAMILVGLAVKRVYASETGRLAFDGSVLRLPLVREFICDAEVARFARTLSLLLRAGVQIDKALELSGNTMGNTVLRRELQVVRRGTVQQGDTLSSGLERAPHFPAFVSSMTAVGEEGGSLDDALLEVAEFYEKTVEQQTRMATSLIEPILILVVGAVVGLIVAAMLLPIFELGTGL